MALSSNLLYGPSRPRQEKPSGWRPATILLPHPKNLVDAADFRLRMIAWDLVPFMPACSGDGVEILKHFVTGLNDRASSIIGDRVVCRRDDGVLTAFVIERLPTWKEKPEGEDSRWHGDHLGVTHYVYDDEAKDWYLIARHGRGIYGAAARPYANYKTAGERMIKLAREVTRGEYEVTGLTMNTLRAEESVALAVRAELVSERRLRGG
jgi:hypothetical protein